MRKLDKDLAFSVPELEVLLKDGAHAMEVADTVTRDLVLSAKEVSDSISRLPGAARLPQAKESADRLASITLSDEYLECRDMLQRNIPRIIEDVFKYDEEAAEELETLRNGLKSMSGEVINFRLLLREDIAGINPLVFGMKLANISLNDEGLNALIAEYIVLEKGASTAEIDWDRLIKDLSESKLSEADGAKLLEWSGKNNDSQIEWLKSLGYTETEMVTIFSLLQTETERAFIINLIHRRYNDIYKTHPDELGENMMLLLWDYSNRLSTSNQFDDLESLVNGMITTDATYSYYGNNNYMAKEFGENYKENGSAYLEKLFILSYSCYIEDVTTLIALNGQLTEIGYNMLYEELENHRDMALLWGSVVSMIDTKYFEASGLMFDFIDLEGESRLDLPYGFRISNLENKGAGFRFNVQYGLATLRNPNMPAFGNNIVGDIKYSEESDLIVTTLYMNSQDSMVRFDRVETLAKLAKEQDSLFSKYFVDSTVNIVGMVWPLGGALLNLLQSIDDDDTFKKGKYGAQVLEKSINEATKGLERV